MDLLEEFRKSHLHTALAVDEYGEIDGRVALGDILEAIIGYVSAGSRQDRPDIVRPEDGSWLVDDVLDIDRFKEQFDLDLLPSEGEGPFNTVVVSSCSISATCPRLPTPSNSRDCGSKSSTRMVTARTMCSSRIVCRTLTNRL